MVVKAALERWMDGIGVVRHLTGLGVTEDMLEGIADGSFICDSGYKKLTHSEIVEILRESM